MEEVTLTISDLATVAGGSVAATIVAQFTKVLFQPTREVIRTVALVTGLVVVVAATVLGDGTTVGAVILAVLVGMQTGMAAWAGIDALTRGFGYQAVPSPPAPPRDPEDLAEIGQP